MPGDLIKTLSKAKEQLMKMPAYGRPPVFYPPDGCCDNPTVPRELGLCSVCNERSVTSMEDPRKMVEGIRKKLTFKEIMDQMLVEWEANLIAFAGMAKIKKGLFDALIKEGFTEQQALILTDLQFKGLNEGGKG